MKQKLVLNVSMNDQKSRSKALKIVVGVYGVESAALKGGDKNQIEVIGDGVDSTALTVLLRKKVGYAEVVTLGPVEAPKKEESKGKESEPKVEVNPLVWPCFQGGVPCCDYPVVPVTHCYHDPYNGCSIM